MINERISYLVTQFLEKRITEAELHELSAVLLENDNNTHFQLAVENLIRQSSPAEEYNQQEWEPVYQKIVADKNIQQMPVRKMGSTWRPFLRYAAVIILVLGAGTWIWLGNKPSPNLHPPIAAVQHDIAPGKNKAILTLANGKQIVLDSAQGNIVQQGNLQVINLDGRLDYKGSGTAVEYHSLSTPRGGQYMVSLPDGSRVWLNAASSIRYPTAFTANERTVDISGEAYLEVAKDKAHPFVVHANGTDIRVLGTQFNINAYPDENTHKTTLIEGSVQVKPGTGKPEILQPGEQAQTANGQTTIIQNADTEQALAWKNGLFNFNNADLPTVMRQLERWYDIRVKYEGPIPPVKFQGKMDRGVNLSEVLEILTRMEIKYKQEGRALIITP